MAILFDPILGKLRKQDAASASIPEVTSDPPSPVAEQAWVLKTGSGSITAGSLMGILGLTYANDVPAGELTYQLSYRTKEGTTVRTNLT